MATADETHMPSSPAVEECEPAKKEDLPAVETSGFEAHLRDRKRVLEERFRGLKVESLAQPSQVLILESPKASLVVTPRQRARLLELQRLREFAATLPIALPGEIPEDTKPKMRHTFLGNKGKKKQECKILSTPGLDNKNIKNLPFEGTSQETHAAQLERFESLVLKYAAQNKEEAKCRDLMRHVSVLRIKFEDQQKMQDEAPKMIVKIKRGKSAVLKSSRAAEKEHMLALLRELDTVEQTVLKWSSVPRSSPRECLREITILRISVMSALEHHPILMDNILIHLTELETTIVDYKSKEKRNEWSRSKEALRRIAVLKVRLTQPDWDDKSIQNSFSIFNPRGSKDAPKRSVRGFLPFW
jgi:hypothetical protein